MTKIIFFFCLLFLVSVQAQQHQYSWKVGLHGGLSYYHGDINERTWDIPAHFSEPLNGLNFMTYGLSFERHFTRTFALRLTALKSQVKGSDRRYADNGDYNRALNVQTDIVDGSLLAIFYFDNGKIFGENAIVSPYAMIGPGMMYFNPKADLLDGNGDRYYYWADNTIRNLDPSDPNALTANIVERDYVYETNLAELRTEDKDYSQFTWAVVFGLGFKVRVTERIYIHGEALLRYTGTDYLDDVAGDYPSTYDNSFQAYASNPSGRTGQERGNSPGNTDWFGQGLVSLHYSFGAITHDMSSSMIYTPTTEESSYSLIKSEETLADDQTTAAATDKKAPAPTRTNTVDTQRVIKIIKVTTTTVTETTIDSSTSSVERSTPISTSNKIQVAPIEERLDFLPEELDSAFYSAVLMNVVEEELIDSLFEAQYQKDNPAPAWLIYAMNKDTTAVPTELVQTQEIPTPRVDNLVNNTVAQVADPTILPTATDTTMISSELVPTQEIPTPRVDSLVNNTVAQVADPTILPTATDTTMIPSELVPTQEISTPDVDRLLNDTIAQVRAPAVLPNTTDTVKIGTAVAVAPIQTLNPDSLRLLEQYRYKMEAERERFRTELKEQQIRYQYELQLQQLKNELQQERKKATNSSSFSPQIATDSIAITQVAVPPVSVSSATNTVAPSSDPAVRNLQDQLARQQQELEALRQAMPQNTTTTTPSNQAEVQALQEELARQQQELADMRQNKTTTTAPAPSNQAEVQTLQEELARQQQELADMRQNKTTTIAPAPSNQAEVQALQEALARQQQELADMRQVMLQNTPTTTTTVVANPADQERFNTLNKSLQQQQNEIAALKEQLRQQAANPTLVPAVIPVPSSGKDNRQELDELMERETTLRLRLEKLEKERLQAMPINPDTVRIVEQVPNEEALVQQKTIEDLRQQLNNIKNEREAISGTLQEFLNKKNPSYVTKIYFDVARSSLTLQAKENLTTLVAYLQNYPTVNFWVKGYASPTGSKATNDRLSRERAATVYNYLRSQGIAVERLQQLGYGESNTGVRNELDRRAEVHLSFPK